MKVSRVIFHENSLKKARPLAICSIILDDCLMISDIRLFHGAKGYYLVLPSKQDVFSEVQDMNKGNSLNLPEQKFKDAECTQKKYDEFYHPVEREFYEELLNTVLEGYNEYIKDGRVSYRPK